MQKHFTIWAGLATFFGLAITIALGVNPDLYRRIAAHGGWWWLVSMLAPLALLWLLIARWWESSHPRFETDPSQPPSEYDQNLFE